MNALRTEIRDNGVAIIILDHPSKAVNTLSPALIEEFESTVAPLVENASVRALVLSSAKKDTFIAGADLDVLTDMRAEAEAAALSRTGNALLSRIANGSKPVVAAVHGAALGGGLEVVLACHYILASDDPATVLGLPEVMLGLLPAGGGTQRLVRRVGLIQALPLLLTGKRLRARKALRLGLVDALTTPGGIRETAVRAAVDLVEGRLARPRPRHGLAARAALSWPGRALVLRAARRQVARQTRGNYPAPPAILDCVATGLARGIEAGLERESEHFGRMVVSSPSRALVWLFHATSELKKLPDDEAEQARQHPVRRLAILGAGFMGSGVASVSLGLCPVVVRDISPDVLARGGRTILDGLTKQVRSGSIRRIEAERRQSRLLMTTRLDDIAGADMVIEAVFEDLELKRKVLAEVEARLDADAVIASNTSALPIHRIAKHARHPERVLGMHYFSPVPKMPLLEIVVTDQTSARAIARAQALGIAQGKTCIVVKDGPGFYTTRILAPYLNEAILLLEEGARIEDVDRHLKDLGFPVGPVALIDEVGIDVGAHVALDLGSAFAERGLGASDALPRLLDAGYQGRKNGHGFYQYPPPGSKGKRKQPNTAIYAHLGGASRHSIDRAEAQDRLALIMVNEAVHCLQEGIIAVPRDGDVGAVMGLGFPPFLGGPFHYVDALGAAAVYERLEQLAEAHGPRFAPAQRLRDMAAESARFFPEPGRD